ncbi:MAG TPA: hypothetical protein VEK11_23795 [Thermoanaerobaculia bacterium]|nr:hypothetical protein [Thermoanaerobaculia bacterium]
MDGIDDVAASREAAADNLEAAALSAFCARVLHYDVTYTDLQRVRLRD